MIVNKTINNNIVSCISPKGVETIVMGRGIGFDFKAGSTIDESRIEKIFSIENKSGYATAKDLFANMPEKLLNICIGIIDKAKDVLNETLNDNVYLTLTDHINFALSKAQEGIDICSAITSEVKIFYPREYLIGKNALDEIESELGVRLPSDEACAIALHIVNAEYNTEIGSIMRITQSISEVLTIIKKRTGIEILDEDVTGAAFISFLKYFVFRVFTNQVIRDKADDKFPIAMEEICPDCYELSETIGRYLYAGSHRKLSKMEKAILSSNIYCFREYSRRRKK